MSIVYVDIFTMSCICHVVWFDFPGRSEWNNEESDRLRKHKERENTLMRQMEEEQARLEEERINLERKRERKYEEDLVTAKDEEERNELLTKQTKQIDGQKEALRKLRMEQEEESRGKVQEEEQRVERLKAKREELAEQRRALEEEMERRKQEQQHKRQNQNV